MVIIVGFYTASHGKFQDRGYSDMLHGINSIDTILIPILCGIAGVIWLVFSFFTIMDAPLDINWG